MHTLLASGQIPTRVRINLANPPPTASGAPAPGAAGAPTDSAQQAITINTNFVNGQINAGSRLVASNSLASRRRADCSLVAVANASKC